MQPPNTTYFVLFYETFPVFTFSLQSSKVTTETVDVMLHGNVVAEIMLISSIADTVKTWNTTKYSMKRYITNIDTNTRCVWYVSNLLSITSTQNDIKTVVSLLSQEKFRFSCTWTRARTKPCKQTRHNINPRLNASDHFSSTYLKHRNLTQYRFTCPPRIDIVHLSG